MKYWFLPLLFSSFIGVTGAAAQTINFEDGFEDGDFTNNPTWSGDTNEFIVIDGEPNHLLQLQGNTAGEVSYLSAPSTDVSGSWEFYIELDFSPSGSNFAEIFLMSDIANLESSVNGYVLQAGESGSNDVFRIIRYDNGSQAAIVLSGMIDISGGGEYRVRVTRTAGGDWSLEVGQGYDGLLQQEATGSDNTYTSANFFGLKTTYTSSRADLFYFDFKIDLPPFTVTDVSATDSQIIVSFNRAYDQSTVQPADFMVDNGIGSPPTVSFPSATEVLLDFNNTLSSGKYTLTAQNISDQNSHILAANSTVAFTVYASFSSGDVIINEFMYDPPDGQAEYIELRNLSDKYLNMQNWQIADGSGIAAISSDTLTLLPNSFLVISNDTTALSSVYGDRPYTQAANFPSLNNSGDALAITTGNGMQVDSLNYTPAWGGNKVALERRSSTAPSIQPNFANSPNALGGTPGLSNEVSDDTIPPDLTGLIIINDQTLRISFSEKVTDGPAENEANYVIDNGILVSRVQKTAPDTVLLSLASPLQNALNYQLTVNNQQDIFGNTATSIDTSFTFYVISEPDADDIYINEFMYDPPSGQTEYIELYNPTDKSLDLQGWTLNDNSGEAAIVTDQQIIIPPVSYVVIAPDETLLEDYPNINLVAMGSSFPSFNNSGDAITVADSMGTQLDSLNYNDSWGGQEIALERRSVDVPPVEANFGESPNGFGTPGSENEVPGDTTSPTLEAFTIVNNQTLELVFSEQLTETSAEEESNYSITGDLSISSAMLSGDTMQVTLSGPLQNNTNYTITAKNMTDLFGNSASVDTSFTYFEPSPVDADDIFINEFMYDPPSGQTEYIELYNPTDKSLNLQGWTLNDNSGEPSIVTDQQIIIPPISYVVIAPDETLLADYPNIKLVAMGSAFPSFNNSGDAIVVADSTGQQLDSLSYEDSWGGQEVALERRSIEVPPIEVNFGEAPNGFGTPGSANEIANDTTPPTLEAFTIVNNQTLELVFSEQLTETSAEEEINYSISGELSISSATLSGDTIRITLTESLQNNTSYTVTTSNIADLFGNTAEPQQESFTYFETSPVDRDDIFINEFMYDPPSGQTEYIELYNPTDKSLDLQGWTLNDNSGNPSMITGRTVIIPPDSYVVIAPDETLLADYPNIKLVAMGSAFPSFNNSGDAIVVADSTGQLLDSLNYDDSWGGQEIALERRTLDVPPLEANFGEAPNGFGTPGKQNEILNDTTPPSLEAFAILDNQTLNLIFNEQLTETSAEDESNYSISGDVTIALAILSGDTVHLNLYDPLQNNTSYTVTASNIADLFDNTAELQQKTFTYFETSPVGADDIFINEFMYDPPSGQTEYIELYNPTDKSLDLQGWTLNDNSGSASVITDRQIVIPPDSYVVLAPDETLQEEYPAINLVAMGSGFPSFNNSGDVIVVADSTGQQLDSLHYDESWGGQEIALERRSINAFPFKANFGESPNGFGTPGSENEVPGDTTPPTLEAFTIVNNQTLELVFSEQLTAASVENESNYTITGGLSISSATLSVQTVQLTLSSALQNNTTYSITASSIADLFGNTAEPQQQSFTYFETSPVGADDIFINEFMYDPPSGQTEYIELYNPTDKSLDLQGWTLNDNSGSPSVITESQFIIPTDSYVVLAPDETLLEDYPNIKLVAMGSAFPSFNNSGDAIVVADSTGQQLDSLNYDDNWGGQEIALERRSVDVPPIEANFGEATNGFGTPGSENLIKPDTVSPKLNDVEVIDVSTIQLLFSESITSSSATDLSNYTFSPAIEIQLITSINNKVTLHLVQALVSDQTYILTIRNLEDIFGNTLFEVSEEVVFVEVEAAQPKEIVINEFLVNGEPEFVELYNRSDKNIDLSGWKIDDQNNAAVISTRASTSSFSDKNLILRPGRYLVVTASASLANLLDNGIYISNLPSFNDDEDVIFIQNSAGITIDSLIYSPAFGSATEGKSAERKDPDAASNDPTNWSTSVSSNGYTAGTENTALQPDTEPPKIIFAKLFVNGDVEVRFNEFIKTTSGLTFDVNDQTAEIDFFDPFSGNTVILNTQELPAGSELIVTAQNVSDVSGNVTQLTKLPVAQPLKAGAVVINEILFDPIDDSDDGLPDQSEYIELYNTKDYAVSLENIYLHNAPDEDRDIDELIPVSTDLKWIPAGGTAIIYASEKTVFSESAIATYFDLSVATERSLVRIEASSLSLSSSGDAVYLSGNEGIEIDSVFYEETWHNPNLIDTDGIALERINPEGASNDPQNWGSSTAPKGGTPIAENTLFQTPVEVERESGISFSTNPFSPDGDGFEDNLIISYKLNEADYLMTVQIYDRYGRLIIELADSKPTGSKGTLTWNGLKEDGTRNRIGIYIVLFRAFDSVNGSDVAFKETVVLARRLN